MQLTPWGSTITFQVSRAGPDEPPDWVDLSDYLRPGRAEIRTEHGRQTELESPEPARLELVLDNGDLPERYPGDPWAPAGRLTSGNPLAPTYPWWEHARRCRLQETIAGRTFDLYDGHIEIAQTNAYMQPVDETQPADMLAPIAAIDRLGRLQNARTFISTVNAHVTAESDLRFCWPLTETQVSPFTSTINGPQPLSPSTVLSTTTPSAVLFAPAAADPIAADDVRVALFTPVMQLSGSTYVAAASSVLAGDLTGETSVLAGEIITLACWVNPSPDSLDAQWTPVELGFGTGLAGGFLRLRRTDSTESPGGVWKAFFSDTIAAGWSASAYGLHAGSKPTFLAMRVDLAANEMSLFVDDAEYPATVTGTFATAGNLLSLRVGSVFTGGIGHVQVYVGSDVDLAAQHAVGRYGLERQYTGERINTILDYAGIPAGMRDIDPGMAVMQRASLAGTSPGDQLENARITERGRLHVTSDGRVTFRDRRALYNI